MNDSLHRLYKVKMQGVIFLRRFKVWKQPFWRLLLSILCGLGWALAGILPMVLLMLKTGAPGWLLRSMADGFWCLGAFRGGRTAGFHARHQGIGNGILTGAGLCACQFAMQLHLEGACSAHLPVRCVLLLCFAAAGGVRGVNLKLQGPPY